MVQYLRHSAAAGEGSADDDGIDGIGRSEGAATADVDAVDGDQRSGTKRKRASSVVSPANGPAVIQRVAAGPVRAALHYGDCCAVLDDLLARGQQVDVVLTSPYACLSFM